MTMARTAEPLPLAPSSGKQSERLEDITRSILEALDSVVAFGHVQSQIRSDRDPEAIFPAAGAQLRRLVNFSTAGLPDRQRAVGLRPRGL